MREESPTRPGVLLSVPPVEVAAARLPRASEGNSAHRVVATKTWRVRVGGEGGFRAFVVVQDVAGEGLVGEACGLPCLGMGETLSFPVQNQFDVVDQGHAVCCGKLLCPRTDKIDMRAFFQHQTRGLMGLRRRSTQATPPAFMRPPP